MRHLQASWPARMMWRFLGAILLVGCFSAGVFAQPLTITTTTLPDAKIGTVYNSVSLTATGGTPPYSWSFASGALPTGMGLSGGGVISGTPTVSGTFNFTVKATDNSAPQQNATQALSLRVLPNIATASLPNGLVNSPYSATLAATPPVAAPVAWTISAGALPPGLSLTSSDGSITGTPTAAGTFNFTVTLTDSNSPPLSTSKPLSITIQPVLTITSDSPLPAATVGVFYVRTLQSSGPTPVTWSVINGFLPPGLSLSTTGNLSGTPAVAGTYDFTVQAATSNPSQTTTKAFEIVVNPALSITTLPLLPTATPGIPYSVSLSATGGVPPYTWTTTGTLPPGLSLSTSGLISGTPASAGNFTFTVQVSDTATPPQVANRTFTLIVGSAVSIITSTLPNGAVNKSYSVTLVGSGGAQPYTWTPSGAVPQGLNLSVDGTLSGTPTSAGTFNFTVTLTDASAAPQSVSKTITVTIQPQLTINTSGTLPLAVVGAFYSQLMDATGPSPLVWSVISGIAPPGLTLTSSGALAGTPVVGGTFDFTVQAAGGDPLQTATKALRVVVNDALKIITAATLPDATLGVPYSLQLEASGGLPPYTWTNPGRGLPPGLSLSSSGAITGTPTGIGTFTFTAQISDSFTPVQQVSRTFTLTISASLIITTTSLPSAVQNVAYSQQLQATGSGPFTWLVTAGTLPAGLTLSTSGLLNGTPTDVGSQTFTVTATDSRGTSLSRDFTLAVNPPLPAFSAPGLPATLSPTQVSDVNVALASPYPSALTGTLKLSFTSNAEIPSDDPMTQFSNGLRTATFTIPANTTAAVFPTKLMLLTGTVAGTVTLTASIDGGPADQPVATVGIPATAPHITDVTVVKTAGGLDIRVTGYAPSRRVSSAEFGFDVKDGNSTKHIAMSRSVESDFSDWYRNPASTQFGSSFSFLQSFTIQGDIDSIQGVSIKLANAQGSTTSGTVAPK